MSWLQVAAVVAHVDEPDGNNTPTFKIYQSSPSKPIGSTQDPTKLKFPLRLLKCLFGPQYRMFDQLAISTSTPKPVICSVVSSVVSNPFCVSAFFNCCDGLAEQYLPTRASTTSPKIINLFSPRSDSDQLFFRFSPMLVCKLGHLSSFLLKVVYSTSLKCGWSPHSP